jgi:LPS export ABC transporter protein LptC
VKIIKKISATTTVFFLIAVLSLAGCTARPESDFSSVPADPEAEVADQVFDGFEMSLTDNGISKGLAIADRVEKYGESQVYRATGLTVLFYTESGRVQSVLTSRRGIIRSDTGDLEAMDSVVVFSSDSTRTLHTEHLVWLKGDNRIQGDSAVVVRGPQGVVNGDGFTADMGFESIDLKNPTGDINVLGDKF